MIQKQSNYALLVIDMQNDFLQENGFMHQYKKADVQKLTPKLVEPLQKIVANIRKKDLIPIFWVYAIYGECEQQQLPLDFIKPVDAKRSANVPLNTQILSGTHPFNSKQPCCKRNTNGSKFFNSVESLINSEKDQLVEKQYFSAFRKTNLEEMLKARGVKTIVLCGVATHYCVKATAVDGFHLGFDVLLLEDCIGAKSEVNHTQAMTEMGQSFAKICKSFDFIEMIEKQQ